MSKADKWAGAWKPADPQEVAYQDKKATSGNGKGDSPRHQIKPFSKNYDKIDWSK